MAQHERGPLVPAELLHRLGDLLAQFGAEQQAVLLRIAAGRRLPGGLGITAVAAIEAAARAKQIERAVDRDPMQPRGEIRTLFESAELAVGPEERFLDNVVGVVLISGHAIGHAKHGLAVTLDEQPESLAIAGAGPAYGCDVGHLHPNGLRL